MTTETLKQRIKDTLEVVSDHSRVTLVREWLRASGRPNAVFIWIPKTAGTSLVAALDAPRFNNMHRIRYRFPGRGVVTFGHMDYARLVRDGVVPASFDATAFKFAFCRNPYERVVSLFFYLRDVRYGGVLPKGETFLTFCRRLHDEGCEDIGPYNALGLSQCRPQVRWLEGVDLQFLGRFETIDDDVRRLFAALGLPPKHAELPRLNQGRRSDWSSVYDAESCQIVEELYRDDFLRFGYETKLGSA